MYRAMAMLPFVLVIARVHVGILFGTSKDVEETEMLFFLSWCMIPALIVGSPTAAPTVRPTQVPTLIDDQAYRAIVTGWGIVDNAPTSGCNTTTAFNYTDLENPVRLLVDVPTQAYETYGSNKKIWQAHYTLISGLTATIGKAVPMYLWLNVTVGPSVNTRYVDIWMCGAVVSSTANPENQLFRRCGPDLTHLQYPVGCDDTETVDRECLCGSSYVWAGAESCTTACGSETCNGARYRYFDTLEPTYAPIISPTFAPTASPVYAPTVLGCGTTAQASLSLCGSDGADIREKMLCTFTVTPGGYSVNIPMTLDYNACNCTQWGTVLGDIALPGGTYTFTCTGAGYVTTSVSPADEDTSPILDDCPLLVDDDPWTRCSIGRNVISAFGDCDSYLECMPGLACRNSSSTRQRCTTYPQCLGTAATDGTVPPDQCAPANTINANLSTWCKTGSFPDVGGYTVRNDITDAWDPANIDPSINAAIVSKIETLVANATAYNQTICMCGGYRNTGWTPHLVMIQRSVGPTPAATTIPPTRSVSRSPTTSHPTTAAPTVATPTAPTVGPPSFPPTSIPTTVPTQPPTALYPYVVDPDNTVRDFYPLLDDGVEYVYQYRLRGPALVVNGNGVVEEMYNESDVLWPTPERCEATDTCRSVNALTWKDNTAGTCIWRCINWFWADQRFAPLIVRSSAVLNITECTSPGHSIVNMMILAVFIQSMSPGGVSISKADPTSSAAFAFLWTPWINMTSAWIGASALNNTCRSDIGGGCITELVYYSTYGEWRASLSVLTRIWLDNIIDVDLKTNTPRLYPTLEFVWDTDVSPVGKATTFPVDENYARTWGLYIAYQMGIQGGSSGTTGECINPVTYATEGLYLHETSSASSPIIANGRIIVTTTHAPITTCAHGQECGSVYGGHVACNALSLDVCETVPLCMNCSQTITQSPVPYVPGTLTPTPPPIPLNARSLDMNAIMGMMAGIIAVIIITLVVVSLLSFKKMETEEQPPVYESDDEAVPLM
jgi:hypothetical protein